MSEFRTTPQRNSGWRRFSVATLFVFMAIGLVTVTLMLPTAFAAFLVEDGHQRSRRKDVLAQRPEGIQVIHHLYRVWRVGLAFALLWIDVGCAHAPEPRSAWPDLPPCSSDTSSMHKRAGHSRCVSIVIEQVDGGSRPVTSKTVLRAPLLDEQSVSVYELSDGAGGRWGRQAPLPASAFNTLCSYAQSEGLAVKPRSHTEPPMNVCFGPMGTINVLMANGDTQVFHYQSELYNRVADAWSHMRSALTWNECAPPDLRN